MDKVHWFYHPMLELPGTYSMLLDIYDIHCAVQSASNTYTTEQLMQMLLYVTVDLYIYHICY